MALYLQFKGPLHPSCFWSLLKLAFEIPSEVPFRSLTCAGLGQICGGSHRFESPFLESLRGFISRIVVHLALFGPKNGPKMDQNNPKMVPKMVPFLGPFWAHFWAHFGTILRPFGNSHIPGPLGFCGLGLLPFRACHRRHD